MAWCTDTADRYWPKFDYVTIVYNRIQSGHPLLVRPHDLTTGFLFQRADSANVIGMVMCYENMGQFQTLRFQCFKYRFRITWVHPKAQAG
jgi:hypothetical protein